MTKMGLDMTYPPTIEQAAYMNGLGYTWCLVYIDGPRTAAHTAWQQVDGVSYPVRDLAPYFPDGFLPVTVGRNVPWDQGGAFTAKQGMADADRANISTGACGFGPNSPLGLDIEYGTYEKYPQAVMKYLAGFVSVANAAGHPVPVYGDQTLMNALEGRSDLVDGLYGADQLLVNRTDEPATTWSNFDPALPPPWMYWQCGNGTVGGVSVDYNTAIDAALFAKYAL